MPNSALVLSEQVYEGISAGSEACLQQQVALAAGKRLVDEAALDDFGRAVRQLTRYVVWQVIAKEVAHASRIGEQCAEVRVMGRREICHHCVLFCCGGALGKALSCHPSLHPSPAPLRLRPASRPEHIPLLSRMAATACMLPPSHLGLRSHLRVPPVAIA